MRWFVNVGHFKAFSRRSCPKRLTVTHSYIHTLMAAMRGADQHIRSSLGFSTLPKDTDATFWLLDDPLYLLSYSRQYWSSVIYRSYFSQWKENGYDWRQHISIDTVRTEQNRLEATAVGPRHILVSCVDQSINWNLGRAQKYSNYQ